MAISIRNLGRLLSVRLPNLRTLELSNITHLEGRWEWVMQFMRSSMQLDIFKVEYGTAMMYFNAQYFGDEVFDLGDTKQCRHFLEHDQEYVIRLPGVRHPYIGSWELERDLELEDDDNSTQLKRDAKAAQINRGYLKNMQDILSQ